MDAMRISQLARRSGVPATTLRFYERQGLLPAERTGAGYRLYRQDALERLAFIGAAKQLGLPLGEIAELLAVRAGGRCREVKADLRPRIAARLAAAESAAAGLRDLDAALRAAIGHLDALPDRDGGCDPRCGFPAPARRKPPAPVAVRLSPRAGAAGAREHAGDRRTAAVACSLSGGGMAARVTRWRRLLAGAARAPLPGGLRLTVPAGRAAALTRLAAAEQRCCPFFDFRLHLDGPRAHLEVRAPAEGAGLLAEIFAPAV
ncbi:MerR family transcriptional regulator [Streptomyces sp. NPDC021224]|uniref:MerR family transcriptional regulator n=1 Tax=unclassified Streptomyces TaxID=2593676 RepID=UPI0037B69832